MERWRDGVPRPPARRYRDYPSFSSTLLDAIYRSIDEMDERGAAKERTPCEVPFAIPSRVKNAAGVADMRKATIVSVNFPAGSQPVREQSGRRLCTSSSSDGSSYGSFSSSDPESVPAAHLPRLRPIRTTPAAKSVRLRAGDGPDPVIPPRVVEKGGKKEPQGSIRSRLRDLTNGRTPASPGARLANFLNSLFAVKSKVSAASTPAATPSSFSQSCLGKSPGTGKRTVRFCPVSVVVGDNCRPCGEKCVYSADRPAAVRRATVVDDDDDVKSDSSSDLFELKNLAAIGRLRDEPPVFGTATRSGNCSTKVHTAYEEMGRRRYKERK